MSTILKLYFSLMWSRHIFTPSNSLLLNRQMRSDSNVDFTWGSSGAFSSLKERESPSDCLIDFCKSERMSLFDDSNWIDLKMLEGSLSGWASLYFFSFYLCFFDVLWSSSISMDLKTLLQQTHFHWVETDTLIFEFASIARFSSKRSSVIGSSSAIWRF